MPRHPSAPGKEGDLVLYVESKEKGEGRVAVAILSDIQKDLGYLLEVMETHPVAIGKRMLPALFTDNGVLRGLEQIAHWAMVERRLHPS